MGKSKAIYSFPDHNQNFWQLASIQSAATGIPVIIVASGISARYGVGTAITSVAIGNLILWIIGLAMITMAAPGKNNALQNINRYLGRVGSLVAAFFLIIAFLFWYLVQLDSANIAIHNLLLNGGNQLRIGAGMGAFIALLSIGGIKLIKHYCVYILPLLLAFVVYVLFTPISSFSMPLNWKFSFLGTISVVLTTLPGIVNLPTFFRHSRSQYDSYLGLSLMIFFTIVFQVFAVVVNFQSLISAVHQNIVFSVSLSVFVILSLISVNLVNIYFASAGWELIFPHRKTNKEFVVVGLLGTLAYTFFQISSPMQMILNIAENFIAGVGIVLIMAFLIKTFAHHRPRPYEKVINCSCWFFGTIIGAFFSLMRDVSPSKILIVTFSATAIAFLLIIFFEETYRSIKNILKQAV